MLRERCAIAYNVSRNDRFYVVAYDGVNPPPVGSDAGGILLDIGRADAEAIATSINATNAVPLPYTRDATTLDGYLTDT